MADIDAVLAAHPLHFTVAQAKELVGREALRRQVTNKVLRRLAPGVLIPQARWAALTEVQRHLVTTAALLEAHPDGWYASRRTAALVHGLPLIGKLPARPQLVRDRGAVTDRGSRRTERVTPLPAAHRSLVDDVPVTSLARTVVDVARDASLQQAVVIADAVLRAGVGSDELEEVLAFCTRWPKLSQARDVIAFADGRAENSFESLSRLAFRILGLPVPEPQVEIWADGALVARVDFLWRDHLVVGEADGRSKYTKIEQFYAEKRREETIRDLGLEVVRWDWDAALHPDEDLKDSVARSLARGRLNRLRSDVRLVSTRAPRRQAA